MTRFYTVQFGIDIPLELDVAGSDYISEISGTITCSAYAGEADEPALSDAGRVLAYSIHGGRAANDGAEMYLECDACHQITADYYSVLFERSGEFREEIQTLFPDVYQPNVLVIDLVEVWPEHRGQRVGLLAARRLLDCFEPCDGIVACKPFPLQFDSLQRREPQDRSRLGLDRFTSDEADSLRTLREYWGQLGFRRIPNTEYYVLSPAYQHPSFRDLAQC